MEYFRHIQIVNAITKEKNFEAARVLIGQSLHAIQVGSNSKILSLTHFDLSELLRGMPFE